jgi:hypothetical protein
MKKEIFNPLILPMELAPACETEIDSCGKVRFSKREAETELGQSMGRARYNPNRREQRAYECNLCGWWHLTSTANTVRGRSRPGLIA